MRNDARKRQDPLIVAAADPDGRSQQRKGITMPQSRTSPPTGNVAALPELGRTSLLDELMIGVEPDAVLARAEAELGPMPDLMRGHYVIDPGAVRAAIGDRVDKDGDEDLSGEHANRMARLRRLAEDPDALYKPHLVADEAMITRLERVKASAPNGGDAIDVVIGSARISALTGAPLSVPSMLLVGPPGCGKTRLIREIGRALEAPVMTLVGSTLPDSSPLLGSGVGWKGAGPSRLAEFLIDAATSGPTIFIDEVEKMKLWDRPERASDVLLGLLDRDMSAAFEDQYLRLPMRADRICWNFAANTLDGLSEPFLDRLLIIEMTGPTRAQRRGIVERIHDETWMRLGLDPAVAIDESVADRLDQLSLRRVAPTLALALGRAATAGRTSLTTEDIAWASALDERGRTPQRNRMGF